MSWLRVDDGWTRRAAFAGMPYEARWHYLALVEFAACHRRYDGVLRLVDAQRCSDVDDPMTALSILAAAGLVTVNEDTVRLPLIDEHVPPPHMRDEKRKPDGAARTRRWRKHKDGDHSECLPGNCDQAGTRDASQAPSQAVSQAASQQRHKLTRHVTRHGMSKQVSALTAQDHVTRHPGTGQDGPRDTTTYVSDAHARDEPPDNEPPDNPWPAGDPWADVREQAEPSVLDPVQAPLPLPDARRSGDECRHRPGADVDAGGWSTCPGCRMLGPWRVYDDA